MIQYYNIQYIIIEPVKATIELPIPTMLSYLRPARFLILIIAY